MSSFRVRTIDSLRGFSLLGIILANMAAFQFGIYGSVFYIPESTLDKIIDGFLNIFINTSFIPIFSILVGFSLMKLVESFHRKEKKSRWAIVRRGIGLIVLGLLHYFYLWDGDILLFYGILTFAALLFVKCKPKTLAIWLALFIALFIGLGINSPTNLENSDSMQEFIMVEQIIYSSGNYDEIKSFRLGGMPPIFFETNVVTFMSSISYLQFGILILLGILLAKIQFFENNVFKKYWKLGLIFIPIGLIIKILTFTDLGLQFWHSIGGQILALGYICAFLLVIREGVLNTAFESVGKISLTNYLMQTVICTTIFYGYGFGLFGSLSITTGFIIAIVIYALQCLFSTWYIRRWTYGPVEALLRAFTNLRWDGLKRKEG